MVLSRSLLKIFQLTAVQKVNPDTYSFEEESLEAMILKELLYTLTWIRIRFERLRPRELIREGKKMIDTTEKHFMKTIC
ncbi:unnamed protein product [Parnassius mnemosyne]|uniref:Uncharacterized protein n=1 Tax=Parnassius mnemosyne TaxID=213953 RepID=A0AAV1LQS9_9NEOP